MRKRNRGRKLSLKRDERKSLLKSLITALILKEKIQTTEAKSKEISRFVEKYINRARQIFIDKGLSEEERKGKILHLNRLLLQKFSPKIVKKLITEIAPKYKDREGGYTRIIKLGQRKSDGAKMTIIELVK